MSLSGSTAAEPSDKRCGGALAALTVLKAQPKSSRNSEFKQLHRHYALQLRDVVRKSASKGEYAPAAVVQGSAWADGDYSCASTSENGDPRSDSEEDDLNDDDFDESAMTAKRDATASLLLVINQPGEPARGALLDVVTALRADYQAQRRKWRRAVEDTGALLQHFACSAEDNESPDVAELMRMNLAKIVARDVGAQNVDVVHATVFFELMRLLQELQRGERMRWILLQTYDELQALVPTLDREWQQQASGGQQQTSSSPGTALTASAAWSPSVPAPRLASSGPQRDYLSRGASRTVDGLSPTSPDAPRPQPQTRQSQPPQTRLSRLFTTTQIRNEAEAQRAKDEARALEALPDEPEPEPPGDDPGGGEEEEKNGEVGGGEMKACVDALREFADLIDTACGQGIALVSVNEVIEAIAEDIKEKLRKAVVGVREEMKPVLYSAETDRDQGDNDDEEEDEGLGQSASATTSPLSSASVLTKGWLVKKGEVRRNWKVRYFVLFEDGRMPYYRAPKKAQKDRPQGCIYLTGKVRLVRPAMDKSVPPNLWAVEVVTATRTYVLCCQSQADLDLWCFHLQSFCSSP